jgi:hypothetical protein
MVVTILPFAFVQLAAVFKEIVALSMSFAIFELANVLATVFVVFGAFFMVVAILPFAFVQLAAVIIVIGALAMELVNLQLAFIQLAAVIIVYGA